jgi:hypothetical protein
MRLSSYLFNKFRFNFKKELKEYLLSQKMDVPQFQNLISNWLDSIENIQVFFKLENFKKHFSLFKTSIHQGINLTDTTQSVHPTFTSEKIVDELDLLFEVFFQAQMTALQVHRFQNPYVVPQLNNHLNHNVRGVGINMALCLDSQKVAFKTSEYYSHEGKFYTDKEKEQISKELRNSFTQALYNQTCIEHLKKHPFHAEEHWFGKELQTLLKYIKVNKISTTVFPVWMQEEWDSIWSNHLQKFPRIEFNLSSSPCEHCRKLFSNLREILNKQGIFIPIVIHYIYPYLTEEVTKSQTLIVPFNTKSEFIKTDLCLKTAYKNSKDTKILNFLNWLDENHLDLLDSEIYDLIAWVRLGGQHKNSFSLIQGHLNSKLSSIQDPKDLAWIFAALQRMPKKMLNQDIENTQLAISSIFYNQTAKNQKIKKVSHSEAKTSHHFCLNFLMNMIVQYNQMESTAPTLNF